jgi:hypothetical protein
MHSHMPRRTAPLPAIWTMIVSTETDILMDNEPGSIPILVGTNIL